MHQLSYLFGACLSWPVAILHGSLPLVLHLEAHFPLVQGVPAQQYDSFQIGMVTTDDFTNADIVYDEALPQIKATFDARKNLREVPIVTGVCVRACVRACVR
eukprot:678167-Pelagomonas_calceolata.AAC.1